MGQTSLTVVPITNIGLKTVKKASEGFTNNSVGVRHVPPNSECPDIKRLYEQYPSLRELPFMLIGDCNSCYEDAKGNPQNIRKYIKCPIVQAAIPLTAKTSYTVTIQKLAAILLSKYKKNISYEVSPDKLSIADRFYFQFERVDIIIVDECHLFANEKTASLEAAIFEHDALSKFDLSHYNFIPDSYESLRKMIFEFANTWNQETLSASINEALEKSKEGTYGKKYSNRVRNEFVMNDSFEFMASVFFDIKNLVMELSENGTIKDKIDSIRTLYDIFCFVLAKDIQVTYKRERLPVDLDKDKYREKITVMTTVVDPLYNMLLERFLQDMAADGKRIILMSATPASWYDYNRCCPPNQIVTPVLFGETGDPLRTNELFYIVPDTRKLRGFGNDSLYKKSVREKYARRIIQIIEMYGPENCLIVAMNKKMAYMMQHTLKGLGHSYPIDYYNSANMIGVESDARVMIALGQAEKPKGAYDIFMHSEIESENRRIEAVHADTFQAWSRVKDPNGKVPSIVFALGCTYEQCKNVCTWGIGRDVEHIKTPYNKKNVTNVTLQGPAIPMPQIIHPKLKDQNFDLTATLEEVSLYKKPVEDFRPIVCIGYTTDNTGQFFENIFINTSFDSLSETLAKLYKTDSLLCDVKGIDGSLLESKTPITDELIRDHIEGRKLIHAYLLHSGIHTNAVCVEFSDKQNMIRLRGFLDLLEPTIKSLITEEDGLYYVWFFFTQTTAKDAIAFVKSLLKSEMLDFKISDYNIYPTQSCKNSKGFGEPVMLPFFDSYKNDKMDEIEVNVLKVCLDK